MDANFLDALKSFIGSLQKEHDSLIKEFIPAKVLDPEHAGRLEKRIKKIEVILREIMDADTAEKLKAALIKAKGDLAD